MSEIFLMTIQLRGPAEKCRALAHEISYRAGTVFDKHVTEQNLEVPDLHIEINLLKWEPIERA
jgi:hypothetical protein